MNNKLFAVQKKILKLIGKYFPLTRVRIWSFRLAGYLIGQEVYIGEELHISESFGQNIKRFRVGDRAAIGQRVLIILDSHPNKSRLTDKVKTIHGTVTIEADTWIGSGVIILPNITIGKQAIVGAGAIVTTDVASRTIVAGNPARVIGEVSDV